MESTHAILANLYAQLGPLIERVNAINGELSVIKANLSGSVPSQLLGVKRPFGGHSKAEFKKRRLSSDSALLLLPDDVLLRILRLLDLRSLVMFSMACKDANFAANDEILWFPHSHRYFSKLECVTFPARPGENIVSVFSRRASAVHNWNRKRYHKASMKTQLQIQARMHPTNCDRVYLASKGGNTTKSLITELNIATGITESEIRLPTNCYDMCVDLDRVYVSGSDIIRVFNRHTREQSYCISNLLSHAYRMEATPQYFYCALWDGNVKIMDPGTGNVLHNVNAHRNPIHSMATSRDFFATGSSDHSIKVWRNPGQLLSTYHDHTLTVTSLQFCRGASHLMSAAKDRLLKLWDVENAKCVQHYSTPEEVTALAWRGDHICLSGDKLGNVFVRDMRLKEPVFELRGHTKSITTLDVSEKKAVSCDAGGTLFIWDFSKLVPLPSLP